MASRDASASSKAVQHRFPTLRAAIVLGLIVGFLELVFVLTRSRFFENGLQRKSRHLVWMLPLADMLLFLIVGVLLSVTVRLVPPLRRTVPPLLLATLSFFALLLALPLLNAVSSLILALGMAAWVVPAWAARFGGFRWHLRWMLPAALLAFAGCVAWPFVHEHVERSAHTGIFPASPDAPNVLLVVMDTMRADASEPRLGAGNVMPNLVALGKRGICFRRAIATAPWTLPSHASMFTGRWTWELVVGPDRGLDKRFPTLAEQLQRHGYETAGFVGNTGFCAAEYGLARGFAHYEDYDFSPAKLLHSSALGLLSSRALRQGLDMVCAAMGRAPQHPFELDFGRKTATQVNTEALRWLDRRRTRPFFIFINYFDTHDPYLLPAGEPYRKGAPPQSPSERLSLRNWIGPEQRERTETEIRRAREAYESCAAYVDAQLGLLLDQLRSRGLLKNTILVVTADHGEEIGEHEGPSGPLFGHRLSVYQQEVHVPLVIVDPRRPPAGHDVYGPVSLRDLPVTIADLTNLPANPPFPGRSLLSAQGEGGTCDSPTEAVMSELNTSMAEPVTWRYQGTRPGVSRALFEGEFSYHRDDQGREHLFDIETDPGELHDLADSPEGRPIADRLGAKLDMVAPTH